MGKQKIIFAVIEFLHLEPNTTFQLCDWTITNNTKVISELIPDYGVLLEVSGTIIINELGGKTVGFKSLDFNDNEVPSNYLSLQSTNLSGLLSLIWFYFDNSIFSSTQVSQDCEDYYVHINKRNNFVSDSGGNYTPITLSKETIDKIENPDFLDLFKLLFYPNERTNEAPAETVNFLATAHKANLELDFAKYTRIQRGFLILSIGRTNSFVIMKIAFYINVLECLLLNDKAELSFKLQLHTSNFIGNNVEDKLFIRNTIKTSYDIRSSFFHGSSVKQNLTELQIICNTLDDIIRRTLLKSIDMKDIVNNKNTQLLDDYLKSLMFT